MALMHPTSPDRSTRSLSAVLFLCLFAGQAGLIALSPVLAQAGEDLGVSTATAGQLRTISGLVAGLTALSLGQLSARLGLRRLLLLGAALLATGSLASAAAGTFTVLAFAQVLIGIAVAVLLTAGTTAAAEWAPAEQRGRVLSWTLAGPAGAWIVGMPLIGVVGSVSWRLALLVLPLVGASLAFLAVFLKTESQPGENPTRSGVRTALSHSSVRRWSAAELLANSAWVGTLVFSGALLVETYGSSPVLTGVVLAIGASAYISGNLFSRRFLERDSRRALIWLTLAMAIGIAVFGLVRPSLLVSAGLFSAAGFAGGGRTLIGNAVGLETAGDLRMAVMGLRAAANQFGYFIGASIAGAALVLGGYRALGLALGALAVLAAVILVGSVPRPSWLARVRRQVAARRPGGLTERPSPEF